MTWLTVLRYRLRRAIMKRLALVRAGAVPPIELGAHFVVREMEKMGYVCHAQYFPVAMKRGEDRAQYVHVPEGVRYRFSAASAVRDALDLPGHVCGVAMIVRFCDPSNPEERHQYVELCMQAAEEMQGAATHWDEWRRQQAKGEAQ